MNQIKEEWHGDDGTPPIRLTKQESEVLRLLSEGLPVQEIAERMELSPRTVTTYRSMIYRKMGVSNRMEAATLFLRGRTSTGE